MITILQHVHYESPGWILNWLKETGREYRLVDLYRNDPLPAPAETDGLVIMGGSMNVYEEHLHPWLADEKKFIGTCIREDKKVLGICLGAQLIAASLGARVRRNPALEIGWFQVDIQADSLPGYLEGVLPPRFMTYHHHGDTFDIPEGGVAFASSEACPNQGFAIGDHVLALQFHLEMTEQGIEDLIQNDAGDLFSESVFVQTAGEIRAGMENIRANRELLYNLLHAFLKK